jgi:hypothetical protein
MAKENVTNEQLAELIQGFGSELRDLKKTVDVIERGAFTEDEKEDVLTVVGQINQQLKDNTLGKDNITLTREEYDGTAKSVGFGNRFETI